MQQLQGFLSFSQLTEDGMLAIKPGAWHEGDEELRSVCVRSSIGHGEEEGGVVLKGEVLVWEVTSVDGLASSAVVIGEVTALSHEVGYDTMEVRVLESEALLMRAQGAEVSSSLRSHIIEEVEDQSASLTSSKINLEEHVLECTHQNINISHFILSTIKIN